MSLQPSESQSADADVLVVGAGPAGLSIALELGLHGRRCLVVEAEARSGLAPRAKTTNVRTRELMRRWGIAGDLARLSPFGIDYPSDVVFATSMRGPELARFENASCCAPRRDDRYSEHGQWIPQYKVEQVLREAARRCPTVSFLQPARLVGFEQDDRGVSATLEDGDGRPRTVRADYLVGADGARSTVRELLGIQMDGISPLGHHRNHIIHAPGLARRHALGDAIMYWLVNAQCPAVLAPLDVGDLWTFGGSRAAMTGDPVAMIRATIGFDDQPVEIRAQDDWTAHQLVAREYGRGRVFLIGDACHLHPPFGGHGMNMGVGDAVDLGWKLNAVLAGWGGGQLLASYGVERGQVHRRVVDESVANHKHLSSSFYAPGLDEPGPEGDALRAQTRERILAAKRPEFDSLGLVIGYHYEDSPVLLREPADGPPRAPRASYEPCARPGCRSPHAWLGEGRGAGVSLFDHYDRDGFTLLATRGEAAADRAAVEAAARAAARSGIPLRTFTPPTAALRELFKADYVLVRPDHHVAWRGDDPSRIPHALRVAAGHDH